MYLEGLSNGVKNDVRARRIGHHKKDEEVGTPAFNHEIEEDRNGGPAFGA